MIIKSTEIIRKIVQTGARCDVCEKEVIFNYPNMHSEEMPDGWVAFESGHYSWGNDSCDSVEKHSVCSAKCYVIKLKECIDELEGHDSGYIGEFSLELSRDLYKLLES